MNATDFIRIVTQAKRESKKEGLKKEIGTWHYDRAVLVETSELDLDTDGGNDPGIIWDKTHQSDTSLHWPLGSPVNSNATRFVVIPLEWGARHGVKLGDVALCTIAGCEKVVSAIVADFGPKTKIGEASIALFRAFGHERVINKRIKDVGLPGPFRMLIFKNTSIGFCRNNAESEELAFYKFRTVFA